jgi:hypothetical protein
MARSYLVFIALGIVFMGFAISGRSSIYYVVAVAFFIIAFLRKRKINKS